MTAPNAKNCLIFWNDTPTKARQTLLLKIYFQKGNLNDNDK